MSKLGEAHDAVPVILAGLGCVRRATTDSDRSRGDLARPCCTRCMEDDLRTWERIAMAKSRREKLLETIDGAWSELLASIDGLTDEEMHRSGVVGDWSVKDILAHVTTWESEALKHLPE